MTPSVPGQYSPDGRWWWDGTRWLPVAPAPPAYAVALYAGFWRRLAGAFIDALVLAVPNFLINVLLSVVFAAAVAASTDQAAKSALSVVEQLASWVATTALQWLYVAFMMSSSNQATLGQMALGIKVTDLHGNRISVARATGRYFASWISVLFCLVGGYLVMLFTERQQTLHDLIAGTIVVTRETPAGVIPARGASAGGGAVALVAGLSFVAILMLVSVIVIVILLTMGNQIQNVFSNVTVALGS